MLRYIVFGVALTGLIIGSQLYLKHNPEMEQTLASETERPAAPSPQIANNSAPQTTRVVQPQNSVPQDTMTSAESPSQQQSPAPAESIRVWQVDDEDPIPPARYTNKGIDARPLKIEKQQFAQVGVGDTLELPVPQTSLSYNMSVKQIGKHRNGDKTLKGHLTNQPQFAVVVTEGQSSTYATINTPDGSFMLEANQGQGWLVAANELDQLVDPNLTDYQIPDIDRTPN